MSIHRRSTSQSTKPRAESRADLDVSENCMMKASITDPARRTYTVKGKAVMCAVQRHAMKAYGERRYTSVHF